MPSCEMCGYDSHSLQDVIVEGSMLSVCTRCSAYGQVVRVTPQKYPGAHIRHQKTQKQSAPLGDIIVEDYAEIIKHAREQKKLTQEALALCVKEKVSLIHKLESQQIMPTVTLARKLEKFLHITLVAPYTSSQASREKLNLQDKALTIGDLIKIKERM